MLNGQARMRRTRRCAHTVILLLLLLSALGCRQRTGPRQDVIARVADRRITDRLLKRSYELDPKWGKGLTQREAYRNQLDFLVSQKLFALDAVRRDMDEDTVLSGYLAFIRDKEMIKALYDREVAAKITVSDEELQEAYARLKKRIRYSYVCSRDFARAEAHGKLLEKEPVDSIRLNDPQLEAKGTTGFLTFGQMHPVIESFVFDMRPSEVRGPVWIEDGYMVVKLIEGEIDKFMSEYDLAQNASKIRQTLFDRKAARKGNEYVKRTMAGADVQLNPAVFFRLSELLSRHVSEEKPLDQNLPVFLSDVEIGQVRSDPGYLGDEVIVTYAGGEMTAGEILSHLANMPSGLRPRVKLAKELKDAIGVIVRNRFLAEEARQQGLNRLPAVREEVEIQTDAVLAEYWVAQQRKQVPISDEEVEVFRASEEYAEMGQRYRHEPSYDEMVELLTERKMTLVKLLAADSLQKEFSVSIDSARFQSCIPNPESIISADPIPFVVKELFQ